MNNKLKYNVGDKIRIEGIPTGIEKSPEILADFNNAIGKEFEIQEIEENGNIVVHVTDVGPLLSIEPEYVSLVNAIK